mgnify:CR=1 FL=1
MSGEVGDKVKIIGEVKIVIRDRKTNKVLAEKTYKNVITDGGMGIFASRMVSPWSEAYWCLELGIGTGTPDSSDTDLFSPITDTRKSGTRSKVGNNQIQYYVRYLPEEANGFTYSELGIWENCNPDLSGGTLINHLLIEPPIEKTSDILVDFYVNIYLT